MPGGTEVSVLLTRLYVPSGDFAEPAYAARTSHWAARLKREARTWGCIIRIGDYGDNFLAGAEGCATDAGDGGNAESGADQPLGPAA
jgi:hypothetical protein